jgi:beta-mannosidase
VPRTALDRCLQEGWRLRRVDPARATWEQACEDWGPADASPLSDDPHAWVPAQVPGNVIQDLLKARRIPDPFIDRQEAQVQWVGECDWLWRLDLEVQPEEAQRAHQLLCLDGLDTVAEVWLDGERLAVSDNMFVPLRLPVTLSAGLHRLVIRCNSAWHHGRMLEAKLGARPLWNGHSSRLYVRKAPYHYGWDWGPTLLTAGPWKPVHLQSHDVAIDHWASPVWLSADGSQARVDVQAQIQGDLAGVTLRVTLTDEQCQPIAVQQQPALGELNMGLTVAQPRLWWPHGLGHPSLYTLTLELLDGEGGLVQRLQRRLGFRHIRLVQEPVRGEPGTSFYFEVNGRALFMGGANWIPDDLLLNRIAAERYRERVQQAVDGGHRMLRVWGGGIYEDDAFYDACDELGVLVWQDFNFACGLYPAHESFVDSVDREAQAAIGRLSHRASLALWCGNNEDYTLAETFGAHGNGKDETRFSARRIYEERLPTLCAELDPQRPYWPGSPSTPGGDGLRNSQDAMAGDRHSWEVWHQLMLPYQRYGELSARFVSEFGLQSHPSMAVLNEAISDPAERRPGSRTLQWHNKASSPVGADGHRRLAVYLADNLPPVNTLAQEVYATQFVQAEAMRHAYEAFRRRWNAPGARACGGALVWQLNDCWPVTSWALIDSGAQLKPAWYTVRRALAPWAVGVRLDETGAQAWACSEALQDVPARAIWRLWRLSGERVDEQESRVVVRANGTTELTAPPTWLRAGEHSYVGELIVQSDDGVFQARAQAWPEPLRWHRVAEPGLRLERLSPDQWQVATERPAKGVWLEAPGLVFSDNFLDVMPGDPCQFTVSGTGATEGWDARVQITSLFDLQGADGGVPS